MITCTLDGKTYFVDCITGRALREIGPALDMYGKIMSISGKLEKGEALPEDAPTIAEAMDVMVKWFCLMFKNQFTPDDVYDKYPADSIMHDIAVALLAVQSQATKALSEFPMRPAATENQAN